MSDSSPYQPMEGFSGATGSERPQLGSATQPLESKRSAPVTLTEGSTSSQSHRRSPMTLSSLCNNGILKMPQHLLGNSRQDKHANDSDGEESISQEDSRLDKRELRMHGKRVRPRKIARRGYNIITEDQLLSVVQKLCTLMISEVNATRKVQDDSMKSVGDGHEKNRASTSCEPILLELSSSELEQATQNFQAAAKMGEGLFGIVYQGSLHQTALAVKMLQSCDDITRFRDQVKVLGRVRHPNLVALLGTCWERRALIYEFVPNGNLEDHLSNEKKSWMLSWQARIRIAYEVCSALMSLHSNKPLAIVHGDVKPANILLGDDLVSKLSDSGVYTLFPNPSGSPSPQPGLGRSAIYAAAPECLLAGRLSPQSDVYCFGVVLLRLLTRKPATGISQKVKAALSNGSLPKLVDPAAGFWDLEKAKQLASLGVMCCATDPCNRPDLAQEVWGVIAPMATSVWNESLTPSPEHLRRTKQGWCCLK